MSDSDTNACGHPVLRRITATYEHALGLEDFPEYCERAFLEGTAPVHALLLRGRAMGPATVTGLNGDFYDIALAVRVIAGRGPSGQGDWPDREREITLTLHHHTIGKPLWLDAFAAGTLVEAELSDDPLPRLENLRDGDDVCACWAITAYVRFPTALATQRVERLGDPADAVRGEARSEREVLL